MSQSVVEKIPLILPKEAGKFIMKTAKDVTIKVEGINSLAVEIFKNLKSGKISVDGYGDDGIHPTERDANAVDWMFVIDTLNFCFWTPGSDTKWRVDGHTGYMALCAALRRAIKEGMDITNPNVYATITEKDLSHIFRSDDNQTSVPLLSTRVDCLHEVGQVLLKKFGGSFKNCVTSANKSALTLMKMVVENFPCFRDEVYYEGSQIAFYKRAQILVADLWSRFAGKKWGEFHDIESLTMFADYRVPQALVHFGVLEYSNELLQTLKQDSILDSGCREEIEIRGASIEAIELVNVAVKKIISEDKNSNIKENDINAVLIDYFLWMYRREKALELEYIPFHKVLGKYY